MRIVVPAILLLVLADCSFMFRKPASDTDYGAFPENYKELINTYVEDAIWIGSGSSPTGSKCCTYVDKRPRKAYVNKGLMFGGGVGWIGYAVPFSFVDKDTREVLELVALIRNSRVSYVVSNSSRTWSMLHYADRAP